MPPRKLGLRDLSLAQRRAAGCSVPRDAARLEALLGEPAFENLTKACAELAALDEAARLERLVRLAFDLLERALAEGSMAAMAFILAEHLGQRHPPRTLALAALRHVDSAPAKPRKPGPSSKAVPPTPAQARKSRLARRLVGELASRGAAVAEPPVPSEAAKAQPAKLAPVRSAARPAGAKPASPSPTLRQLTRKLKESAAGGRGWPLGP